MKPVAYRYFDKDIGWLYHDWKDGFTAKGVVPLYTHPAKTLTDEEINEIAQQCWVYPQGEQAIFNQHKFAKAILKKVNGEG
jgi:hypothetical protein